MRKNINMILEGLHNQREVDSILESFDILYEDKSISDIDEDFYYQDSTDINEATMVTFGGKMYPTDGYAVILAGGSGSGKSFVRKTKLAIDAKVIDVDRLKELYMKAAKKLGDDREYDLKNSKDVSDLHQLVKDKHFKDETEAAFFNAYSNNRRPNVIYDITGDDPKKLSTLGTKLKDLGYKVVLVWVVTNRQVAMLQNLGRSRVVSQEIFHKTHNDVTKAVFPFLKSNAKDYDEAWIVFNSGESPKTLTPEERKELNDMGTVALHKKGSNFDIPKDVEDRLMRVLGPAEANPKSPETYKSFSDISRDDLELAKAGKTTLLAA